MPQVLYRAVRARSGYPNWRAIRREVERELDLTVKPTLLNYFKRIVAPWKHKVDFGARKRITSDAVRVYVFPKGRHADIWGFVSGGTKPHIIEPTPAHKARAAREGKRAALKFQWAGPGSYKPRTTTSGGYKGPGKSTGPVVAFARVEHPGNKPRNFEKWIKIWYSRRRPNFRQQIENAMRRGARKA